MMIIICCTLISRPRIAAGVFADIGRRQDAGGADTEATDEARDDEDFRAAGGAGSDRADDEGDRRQQHDFAAADDVGEPAGEEGADRAADQDRSDIHSGAERAEVKGVLEPLLGAVNDPRCRSRT